MLTMITTVDDLNYPEKTETYYIVNAPYVFSACWKVSHIRLDLLVAFLSCYIHLFQFSFGLIHSVSYNHFV
jgi:hypothetical protein